VFIVYSYPKLFENNLLAITAGLPPPSGLFTVRHPLPAGDSDLLALESGKLRVFNFRVFNFRGLTPIPGLFNRTGLRYSLGDDKVMIR
jgi:hypothetical protein